MPVRTANPPLVKLYDRDFVQWTEETARQLRVGRTDALDLEHLAEEIEDMGRSQRRELESRSRVLLVHLLKWGWQRDQRSSSWKATVANQRAELRPLLRDSPSLIGHLRESLADVYRDAVEEASLETGLPAAAFPERCPFTPEQLLDRAFLPE
jgi:hypothetical protein